jgi:hypothetical protein
MMRPVFTRYGKYRLLVIARRIHERGDNPGGRFVVDRHRVRAVFLADEMERDSRTARIDVVPPKGG